jgi:hypothetical protein
MAEGRSPNRASILPRRLQLAQLSTRRDQAFVPLNIMFGSVVIGAALVIGWIELSGGIASEALELRATVAQGITAPVPLLTRPAQG